MTSEDNLPAPQQSQTDESVAIQVAGQSFSHYLNDSDSNLHPATDFTRAAPYCREFALLGLEFVSLTNGKE